MGELVNLNQYRKERAKRQQKARAAANKVRMGLPDEERREIKALEDRRNKELDGKRLAPPAPPDEPTSS